jgi:hypothetical protein
MERGAGCLYTSAGLSFSLVVKAARGGFEPPRPVSQSNGLANRSVRCKNTKLDKGLRLAQQTVAHHLPTDTCNTDPDLAAVVAAWPELPEAVKAGILAMVKAAQQTTGG